MKICDLTQFYSPVSGGVKRYVREKVHYLHAHTQDDEHVLIIPGERDELLREERARVYTIKSPLVSRTSRYRVLLRLERVEQILCEEMPDVIESGDPYQVAWKAIVSGKALRIPVIGFYHSHFPEAYLRSVTKFFGKTATEFAMDFARRYVRALYNRFACTLVPSPALAAVLAEWGVGNLAAIDLGVDTDLFRAVPSDAAATRADLGIPQHRFLLLYVGRLAPEKNTRLLFDAFRILHRREPERFHLLIAGHGSQVSELDRLRAELAPNPAITWLPYCEDSARLAQLYRAADLFVHPGVQETFGLVSLESQACGTPVIGIRGSYMDRIIHSDQTLWASHNSPEALAEGIFKTSAHPVTAANRQTLASFIASRYSWRRVFDRLFEIYRTIVKEYRQSP